jgi:hypothetical protein
LFLALALLADARETTKPTRLRPEVAWSQPGGASVTTPTLQVVVNPPLLRGSPIHDAAFRALHDLAADYARFVPWRPYPRLAVAELEPPSAESTSWDFSLIDPLVGDFLAATKGHPSVINFSTTPQWMWVTPKPVAYPADPSKVAWNYEGGTELRDPSGRELADYYGRIAAWYTAGGFVDEVGRHHPSDHHDQIDYWEVLNEIEPEHAIDIRKYTKLYDQVVKAVRTVTPRTKFVGMALGRPRIAPESFEYFLDPKNHEPGIPLDAISYHFYATPTVDQPPEIQQFTVWDQAEGFVNVIRYIEQIRKRLSPQTKVMINEVGAITADDIRQREPGHVMQPIPASYWNLIGGMFAYLYGECANMGIDVIAASQLVGYPTQYPSVSLVDWNTGEPNARFWALKLLRDHLSPEDRVVAVSHTGNLVYAQGFLAPAGERKLLVVNKRNTAVEIEVRAAKGGTLQVVDQETGSHAPRSSTVSGESFELGGYGVAILQLPTMP